jgi:hypothetical protein
MDVSGQLHGPAALPPGESAPGTHWIGGQVGPRVGLGAVNEIKFLHCRESNPGRPAHSPSLYRLRYPASYVKKGTTKILQSYWLSFVILWNLRTVQLRVVNE